MWSGRDGCETLHNAKLTCNNIEIRSKDNPVSFEVDITLHCFVYISFFHMVESNIRKQSMDLCLSEFYSETSVGST